MDAEGEMSGYFEATAGTTAQFRLLAIILPLLRRRHHHHVRHLFICGFAGRYRSVRLISFSFAQGVLGLFFIFQQETKFEV